MVVRTDDAEQISSEYSMAGNVYSELKGEEPEYTVVNKPKKTLLPDKAKEPPPQAVITSLNPESSPLEKVIPIYAQPAWPVNKKRNTLQQL